MLNIGPVKQIYETRKEIREEDQKKTCNDKISNILKDMNKSWKEAKALAKHEDPKNNDDIIIYSSR